VVNFTLFIFTMPFSQPYEKNFKRSKGGSLKNLTDEWISLLI
jgi:hypothetical protein